MAEHRLEQSNGGAPGERSAANVVYILYLVGFITFVTSIVGLVMAYSNRDKASEWVRSHYDFQIRTFWIGLACLGLLILVIMVGPWIAPGIVILPLTISIMLVWPIWWVLRCVKGMTFLGQGEALSGDESSPARRALASRWRTRGAIVVVLVAGTLVTAAVAIVASESAFRVVPGQHALVLDGGTLKRVVKDPGLNFKIPIIERVFVCEMYATKKHDLTGNKIKLSDGSTVALAVSIKYKIADCQRFHYTAGSHRGFYRRVREILGTVIREEFGRHARAGLAAKREAITEAVKTKVQASARSWGGELTSLSIKFP